MDPQTRRALESIRLDWATTRDDIWEPQALVHVDGLHSAVIDETMRSFSDARASTAASPLGVVIQGPAGSGKTHLLGQVRERVQNAGGYFFLAKLLDGTNFWQSIIVCITEDLNRPSPTHSSQLVQLLDQLGREAGLSPDDQRSIVGDAPLSPEILERFIRGVYRKHPTHRRRSQHILRALVLTAAEDFALQDLGAAFLFLQLDDDDEAKTWGIQVKRLGYQEVVENISRILAMDEAAVLAIDQLDTLIVTDHDGHSDQSAVDTIAHGLMTLRETLSRTTSIVSCLSTAWTILEDEAPRAVVDRFRKLPPLQRPTSADFGRALLARRFAAFYETASFTPPYPTWPINEAALAESINHTPRTLMQAADRHIGICLRTGTSSEMMTLRDSSTTKTVTAHDDPEFAALDQRFDDLIRAADPTAIIDPSTEDTRVPELLMAGLATWVGALAADAESYRWDDRPGKQPNLHARLRRTIDPDTDAQQSWSFRAIASTNAIAAQTRLAKASAAAGLTNHLNTLVILRQAPWPSGPKTATVVTEFIDRGGRVIAWSADDIRVLIAVRALRAEHADRLGEWIVSRNPVSRIAWLDQILSPTGDSSGAPSGEPSPHEPDHEPSAVPPPPDVHPQNSDGPDNDRPEYPENNNATTSISPQPSADDEPTRNAEPVAPAPHPEPIQVRPDHFTLGSVVGALTAREVGIDLEALRKHTVIFAGSGSGKTVLIRRIIEECALRGVSSIVLDVNNDLARLGQPWPAGSREWPNADEETAARDYIANTDVAVFTPGKMSGRPLSFQMLPDFTEVVDNPDEFGAAVASALGALAPRALAIGKSAKHKRMMATLKQTIEHFGRTGGGTIDTLVDLLADLPDTLCEFADSPKLGRELSDNLRSDLITDHVYSNEPVDPSVLLTPPPGYRARVSVINLSGLPDANKRNNFIGQLQMSLFAWIKKHPAGNKPLGAVLVMDEAQNFAPSEKTTTCTESTLALAAQARKYGLGLIFATQAPKGLHSKIAGNASNQFLGRFQSPVHISAAKELAAAKSSDVSDIGRLTTGVYYAAVDGGPFTKIRTPLCLSYHPPSPPSEEEVIAIARTSASSH